MAYHASLIPHDCRSSGITAHDCVSLARLAHSLAQLSLIFLNSPHLTLAAPRLTSPLHLTQSPIQPGPVNCIHTLSVQCVREILANLCVDTCQLRIPFLNIVDPFACYLKVVGPLYPQVGQTRQSKSHEVSAGTRPPGLIFGPRQEDRRSGRIASCVLPHLGWYARIQGNAPY